VKRTSSKTYLATAFGILFVLILFFGVRFLLKNYLLNIYYPTNQQVVAVFNGKGASKVLPTDSIICYRAVFKSTALWSDQSTLEAALSNRDVLITVETWLKGTDYKSNVLTEVANGRFDKQIRELAAVVAKSKNKVFIRWNPDMEVPTNVYPWQFKLPTDYIVAFNYFSKRIKQFAPKVKIVWGPSGYPGDTEYWPGNQYVDYVSITLGSSSESTVNYYPPAKTIPEMLKSKLHRLRFIDKPVLIMGDDNGIKTDFKPIWLADQQSYYHKYINTVYNKNVYADSTKIKPERTTLKIGVFDPNKKLLNQSRITVEHLFTDWGEVERGDFEKNFRQVISRHHEVIVTMEPWRDNSGITDTTVLENILKGRYDKQIKKLFAIISSTKTIVYLRWMHEMEIPIHRYAWQSQDPVTYINAFRYFMQFDGGPGINVKKVWGPAGDRGSVDFWPGDDVVDYISIAIYGLPDKNITDPEKQEAFSTIFSRKYYRMRFLDKPLFITEFGVKGSESFQNKWLANAAKTINTNPHIFGICYFNLYDNPKAWGNIKAPDWSMTPQSMIKFCSLLKK
jgi:beta-mannanase